MVPRGQRLQLDPEVLLHLELHFVQFEDLELLYTLVIPQILDERDRCLDRVELVVTGVTFPVLEYNHMVRHWLPLGGLVVTECRSGPPA